MESWTAPVALLSEYAFRLAFALYVLLRRKGRNATTLAWILVILIVPLIGVVLYLLVGEVRIGARRARRHEEIVGRVRKRMLERAPSQPYPELPRQYVPIATLAEAVGDTLPRGGNLVDLEGDTERVIDALVRDIDAARRYCHLLYFIYLDDGSGRRVADALRRAAGRGVECRLLVDAVGSRAFLRSGLRRSLEAAGVRVEAALPASLFRVAFARIDLRNHRKLTVIDGRIAYTGSQNIADASFAPKRRYAPWVDATLRIEGPVVRDLHELFVEDWYLDAGEPLDHLLVEEIPPLRGGIPVQVMGTGPGSYNEALEQLVQAAIHLSREELILTTPYFVPDEGTVTALATAARRGVATTLVVPRRNDSRLVAAASRAFYQDLLDAGVEICEFTAGLLHAKTLTLDRDLALVTTANLDRRSFDLNFEISTVVYDSDFASQLRFLQRSYVERSVRIEPSRWACRPWTVRALHNAAGALSPLL